MKPLEIYVHIPFCERKCHYCDFLSFPAREGLRDAYVKALMKEIGAVPEGAAGAGTDENAEEFLAATVFFGGGTPSLLSAEAVRAILEALKERFPLAEDAEITIEANPGTLDGGKLAEYRAAGINRLSLGLQSTDDRELELLGRIHDYRTFEKTYRLAREAGFANINLDLMCALPGQTLADWERTLRTAAALGPEHISAYSLILEEGTPFYERFGADGPGKGGEDLPLPSEETERAMYRRTGEVLRTFNYMRYEISNYARPGYVCRHNEGYWTGADYLGLGLGASSYIDGVRFANTVSFERYLARAGHPEAIREGICRLSEEERQEEFFFLGLRRTAGVSREEYRRRFGEDWDRYERNIRRLREMGFLEETGEGIRLTEEGIDVSNAVFAELLI